MGSNRSFTYKLKKMRKRILYGLFLSLFFLMTSCMGVADYGYEVKPIHSALGEYEAIQDIFRQHVQDCIDDLYGKRSSHRPTIPNIK